MKLFSVILRLLAASMCGVATFAEAATPAVEPESDPARPRRDDPSTWVWNHPGAVEFVRHGVVFSACMQREVGYNIYLPPEYDAHPERRYSVVYFLHGARGNEQTGARLASVMQRELEAGRVGPVVWVYVNGGPYSGYRDWPDSYVRAETMLLEELMPAIEARYRVRTDRAGRAICGYSMGGNGSVRIATKYPDRFCAVASIAGAFGRGDERGGTDTVFHWARQNAEQLRNRFPMWFFVGAKDPLKAHQARFFAVLDEMELGYRYAVIEGKGHLIGEMWEEVCPEFVRVIAGACAPPLG